MPTLVPLAISMQEYTGTFVSCYNVRGPCAKATCCGVVMGCDSKGYLAQVLLVAPQRRCLHHDLFPPSVPLSLCQGAVLTFVLVPHCVWPTRPSLFLIS